MRDRPRSNVPVAAGTTYVDGLEMLWNCGPVRNDMEKPQRDVIRRVSRC